MRAAYTTTQLMQLGQPKLVGPFDQNGVGAGDINAGLNNGGAHQYIEALVIEIGHYLLKLTLAHLAMGNINTSLWHQFGQFISGALDAFDIVVPKIHLTTAQNFSQNGLSCYPRFLFAHKGFD